MGIKMQMNCQCKQIRCVCDIILAHKKDCQLRVSSTCPIPIECQHGYDVCPSCDVCTCKKMEMTC